MAVRLEVFDVLGRRVATLFDGTQSGGRHTVVWEAGHLASGLYLVRMQVEVVSGRHFTAVRKMILLK